MPNPAMPRKGWPSHPAAIELFEQRFSPLFRHLDPPSGIHFQNLELVCCFSSR